MATTHSAVRPPQNSNIVNPLCVTVKEQKGSTSSTGVNSPPRTTLPWRSGGPAHRGCSAGSPAATRCCGTAATSRAITWSETTTCSTCWVEALTHETRKHVPLSWGRYFLKRRTAVEIFQKNKLFLCRAPKASL